MFPVHVDFHPDEPLISYASRLARANGLLGIDDLFRDFEIAPHAESGNFVRIRKCVKSGGVQGADNKGITMPVSVRSVQQSVSAAKAPHDRACVSRNGSKACPTGPHGGL